MLLIADSSADVFCAVLLQAPMANRLASTSISFARLFIGSSPLSGFCDVTEHAQDTTSPRSNRPCSLAQLQDIQCLQIPATAWTPASAGPHRAPVRVLTHTKTLDDCFGDFLVRVVCVCGSCREIESQALARLVGGK